MCPGLSDDLQQIHDARKTAIIDRELSKLKVDIAALQETRLPASGSLKEKDYTFFWQGLEPEERRLYGVGFAVRNTLLSSMEPPSQGTARILSLRLSTPSGPANIFSVYAPTLCATAEAKDAFYEEPPFPQPPQMTLPAQNASGSAAPALGFTATAGGAA